jgi:hypothetical protein
LYRLRRCAKGSLSRRSVELRASGAVGLRGQAVCGCQIGLYRRTGQHEMAHEYFSSAASSYREMGMSSLKDAEAELRELS